jgi:hypothetical protein
MTQSRIMVYSMDSILLNSRSSILENKGYRVFKAVTQPDADLVVSSIELDLCVLCHSILYEDRTALMKAARKLQPCLRFLWLCKFTEGEAPVIVESCRSANGPECLLQCVSRVLTDDQRRRC